MNAYLFAIREHADEKLRDKIDAALEPPLSYRPGGVPVGFDDEDMWSEWEQAARTSLVR